MKLVYESHLLYLLTRIYKVQPCAKPVRNFSCLRIFNIFPACASFPHTGSLCKNAGQCTKAAIYHGRLRNMYQVHKNSKILLYTLKVPVFEHFIQVDFFSRNIS